MESKCGGITRPLPIRNSNTHGLDLDLDLEVTDVAKDRNIARIRGYGPDSWVHASSLKPVIKTLDGKLL